MTEQDRDKQPSRAGRANIGELFPRPVQRTSRMRDLGPPSDAELILRAATNPESFGELFERHFDAVFRFCERRVGRTEAEDLAGETFRRAFERRHLYDFERESARPWLFGIAMNLVKMELRSRAIHDRAYSRLATLADVSESDNVARMLVQFSACDDLRAVAAVLVALPDDDVEALLLHVWDGLSYSEVAAALGIPVGTVRSRLSRLRRRLEAVIAHQDEVGGRTGEGGA